MKTKHILMLLLMVIFWLSSSQLFIVEAKSKISSGSSIAGIELTDITYEDAKSMLENEVKLWQAGDPLIAESKFEQIEIPRSVFTFDIDASIQQLKKETKRHWFTFFLKKKNVQLPIKVTVDVEHKDISKWPERIDKQATLQHAQTIAEQLGNHGVKIEYKIDPEPLQEEVAEVTLGIGKHSKMDLQYMADSITGVTIDPKQPFSFLDNVKLPEEFTNSTAEMNFMASAFYSLFLQTNFQIAERHSQATIPSYENPGINAAVSQKENKDLLVYNPNHVRFTIQAELSGEKFTLSLLSFPSERIYQYKLKEKQTLKPKTIYRYSSDVSPGEVIPIYKGKEGVKVDVYRETLGENGGFIEKELISREYYRPEPRIFLASSIEDDPDPVETEARSFPDGLFEELFNNSQINDEFAAENDDEIQSEQEPEKEKGEKNSKKIPNGVEQQFDQGVILRELKKLYCQYAQKLDEKTSEDANLLKEICKNNNSDDEDLFIDLFVMDSLLNPEGDFFDEQFLQKLYADQNKNKKEVKQEDVKNTAR